MPYEFVDTPPAATNSGRYVFADQPQQPQQDMAAIQAAAARGDPTAADRLQALEAGVGRGFSYLAALPVDALANTVNLGKAATGYGYHELTGKAIPPWLEVNSGASPVGAELADVIDQHAHTYFPTTLDRPDDKASRYLATAGSVLPGAVAGGGGAVSGMARAAMLGLPSALGGQAVMEARPFGDNAAGNTAASALAQLALGLGAPAATKLAIRGGDPSAMQATADTFRDVGAEPTLAQASGTRRMRFLESALSKIPGGAGVFHKAAGTQAGDIGQGVSDLVDSLSPDASFEGAGRAIEQGVKGPGGALEKFTERSRSLYDELDNHISPDQSVSVKNTLGTLNRLAKPIAGAEQTSGMLVNPKVTAIREALQSDVGDSESQQLPYAALKGVRSQVGEMLGGSELVSGVSRAQLKQLYGSLSQDMQRAAQDAGPEASRVFNAANHYYKTGVARMDALSDLLDKQGGPEAVFNSAMSGTQYGASRLRDVLDSIGPAQQKVLTATVLKRMGTAAPGQQNAAGDAFSPQTFLTNWHRMSGEAKDALFGDADTPIRERVENVAAVAGNLREGSKVFANPSGTAGAEEATHSVRDLLVGMLGGHALAGPHGALGVAGGALGAYGLSRGMTSPGVVNWAARPVIGSGAQAASLLSTPANLSDQRRQLAQALAAQQ